MARKPARSQLVVVVDLANFEPVSDQVGVDAVAEA